MSCRFVVLTDTHFSAPPVSYENTWWNRTTERFSGKMGEALIELVNGLAPDFAIHCGDFVGTCSAESFEYGASVMDRLGCPWYMVPGNHDTWCTEPRTLIMEKFETGTERCSYIRDIGGLRFVFLDIAQWYVQNGGILPVLDREAYDAGLITGMGPSEKDINWLGEQLACTTLPTVLISHAPVAYRDAYPAATLPHGKPVQSTMTAPAELLPDIIGHDRLQEITHKYHALKACFAGHWHINDVLCDSGVWHILTAALREFPYEIRLVEFAADEFTISTHRLDVPKLIEYSYVKDWNNRWIEGGDCVRTVKCPFR